VRTPERVWGFESPLVQSFYVIQLFDGVYAWSAFNPEKKFNFNGHFLRTSEGTVIVDPVPFSADDLAYIETAGLKPDALVITNRNHLRERESVLKRWKIPTVLHGLEAAEAGVTPDVEVRGGSKVHGLVCVHLPGKSPGEIALHWPQARLLIVGDALIAPYGRLKTVPVEKQDDPAALKRSLETLRTIEFDRLLVGDGDPLLGGAKGAVCAFLDGNR
jgi:glyoxylase-like metal-dependent hydrolase (beta-lactamase superfamily II)